MIERSPRWISPSLTWTIMPVNSSMSKRTFPSRNRSRLAIDFLLLVPLTMIQGSMVNSRLNFSIITMNFNWISSRYRRTNTRSTDSWSVHSTENEWIGTSWSSKRAITVNPSHEPIEPKWPFGFSMRMTTHLNSIKQNIPFKYVALLAFQTCLQFSLSLVSLGRHVSGNWTIDHICHRCRQRPQWSHTLFDHHASECHDIPIRDSSEHGRG